MEPLVDKPLVKRRNKGKLNYDIILEKIIEGKTPMTKIAKLAGSNANTPQAALSSVEYAISTPGFQEKLVSMQQRMEKEVSRIMTNMEEANLESVEYRDKVQALTKLIEKVELLKGNATHRVDVDINEVKTFLSNA